MNRVLGLPRLLSVILLFHELKVPRIPSILIRRFYPNWPKIDEPPDLPFEEQIRFFWKRKK
jgi:hypothetical protein